MAVLAGVSWRVWPAHAQGKQGKGARMRKSDVTGPKFGPGDLRVGVNGARGSGLGCVCVCPRCGYIEVQERGTPCAAVECPQCGAPMTRD